MELIEIRELVEQEFHRATRTFDPFHSAHEGFAVLMEEVDELWDEVKANSHNHAAMRAEAVQVAAMAFRFLKDCCSDGHP